MYVPFVCPGVSRTSISWEPNARISLLSTVTSAAALLLELITLFDSGSNFLSTPNWQKLKIKFFRLIESFTCSRDVISVNVRVD